MDQEVQTQMPTKRGGGAGKIILAIVLVLVVLGGGYVAYAKFVKKATSFGSILSPSTLNLNPNCKYNDPDLCKFMNNWKDVKYMTMSSDSVDKDGVNNKMTLKSIGTDKSQLIAEQAGKETYNYITIGNTTYTKDYADDKWFKYTTDPSNDLTNTEESKIDFDTKAENLEDKTTYQKIGSEACGKFTCFKYQVVDPAISDNTEYIYFDNKEYMLRKTRNEGKDGSIDEATYDYTSFSISEPSPVKEGNPYDLPVPANALPDTTTTTPSATPATTTPSDSSVDSGAFLDNSSDSTAIDPGTTDFPTEQ